MTEKDEDEEEDKEVCDDEEEETGAAAAATGVKVKENDEKTSHQPEGRVEAVDFGSEEAKGTPLVHQSYVVFENAAMAALLCTMVPGSRNASFMLYFNFSVVFDTM